MTQAATVTIEHVEVKKRDIERVKHLFNVTDNVVALQKAMDMAAGKIELETLFNKHKGVTIEKVYA